MLSDPETWVERHGDALLRYAYTHLRDRSRAADLVQDTFVAALKACDRFDGRSAERTWFIGILRHKIIDQYRRGRREVSVAPEDVAEQEQPDFDARGEWRTPPGELEADPENYVLTGELARAIRSCVDELPEIFRQAFILREFQQLDTDEVCKILEITSTNLSVRLHRARLRLRRCLEHAGMQPTTSEGM